MQDCIPTSLLKLSADNSTRAVKMFAGVQKYMAESGEAPVGAAKAELVQKLLHQVWHICLALSPPSCCQMLLPMLLGSGRRCSAKGQAFVRHECFYPVQDLREQEQRLLVLPGASPEQQQVMRRACMLRRASSGRSSAMSCTCSC